MTILLKISLKILKIGAKLSIVTLNRVKGGRAWM